MIGYSTVSTRMRRALSTLILAATALVAGCGSTVAEADPSLQKPSDGGLYRIALEAPAGGPAINELHRWRIRVTTPSGAPVPGARIDVDADMPEHGHGMPTRPRVTRELEDGVYLLDGMKFSMGGRWRITLAIDAKPGHDKVAFETIVDEGVRAAAAPRMRDYWSAAELRVLASLQLSAAPPRTRDPSNAYEDEPAAASLGRALFDDRRLSRDGTVACATCHEQGRDFQDGRALGRGLSTGTRRTMPVAGARGSPFLFWDGRKDSLWSQALGPFEAAAEHGSNRARVAAIVRAHYAADYEAAFGPFPDLPRELPDASPLGSPAERAAWQRLPASVRDGVNRVFANVGKAIASFESRVEYGESRFDRYVAATLAGDARGQASLSPTEVQGLRLFVGKGRCVTCHNGPLFTDHAFHNTGVPPLDPRAPDRGRAAGLEQLAADEFNCLGRYSDARPDECGELRFLASSDPRALGAFRTPSLRNVALRSPYMHAGQFATLEAVVAHYASSPAAVVGRSELARSGEARDGRQAIRLSDDEAAAVAAFLRSLSGPVGQVL